MRQRFTRCNPAWPWTHGIPAAFPFPSPWEFTYESSHWAFPTPDSDIIIPIHVWLCLYMSSCAYTYVRQYRSEGNAGCGFPGSTCLVFPEIGSFTGEELSEQGRLAASGLQDLPGLCLPNTGIVDSCHHIWLLCPGSDTGRQVLPLVLRVHYWLNQLAASRYNTGYWTLVCFLQGSCYTSFLSWLHLSN